MDSKTGNYSTNSVNVRASSEEENNVKKHEVTAFRHCKSILKTYEKVGRRRKAKTVLLAVKKTEKRHEIQAIDIFEDQDNVTGSALPEEKEVWLLCCEEDGNNLPETGREKEIECSESAGNLEKVAEANDWPTGADTPQPAHPRKNIFRRDAANIRNVPNILRSADHISGSPLLVPSEEENEEDTEDKRVTRGKREIDELRTSRARKQMLKIRHELPASTDAPENYDEAANLKNKISTQGGNKGRQQKGLFSNLPEEKRLIERLKERMKRHEREESRSREENLPDTLYSFGNEFLPSISPYDLSQKSDEIYKDQDLSVAGDARTRDPDLYDYSSEYEFHRINSEFNKADYIDCLRTNFMDISDSDEIHKLLCPTLDDSFSDKSLDQNGNNINVYEGRKGANVSSDLIDCESLLNAPDSLQSFDKSDVNYFKSDEGFEAGDGIREEQGKDKKSGNGCKGGETEAAGFAAMKIFQCPLCSLSFKTARSLAMHRSGAHAGPFIFQCETCGLLFNQKYVLNRHSIDCLHSERRFICNICDRKYKHRSSLLLHTRKVHRVHSLRKTSYTCQLCEKEYKNYTAFEKHLSLHCEW